MLAIAADINVTVDQIIDPEAGRFVLPTKRRTKYPKAHIPRWLIILACVLFVRLDFMFGTTVVVLRGPEFVALGADSMAIGVTTDQSASSSECKIRQINKIFVAAAGANGQPSGFNVFEIARKLSTGRTDATTIATFRRKNAVSEAALVRYGRNGVAFAVQFRPAQLDQA